jgi:PAS domain S-box-containing protein
MRALMQLTASARSMGVGDLKTPITIQTKTLEFYTLAQVMDKTRVQLLENIEALSEAHQWSETLIQSVVEGFITCDSMWRILFFSAGATRITGWNTEEAVGKPLDVVLPLIDDTGKFSDYVPSDGGRQTAIVRHHGGALLTLAVTRSRQSNNGQITIVIHDISEETRRRKAQTYFLANMSHEFRTPLAGMQASVELLLENLHYLSTEEIQQLLNSVHLSLSMLHQLIDNLLESSKLEANHFSLNLRTAEVELLLGEAIRLVEPMLARREQRLTLEEPLTLPVLQIDPTRIIQVIVNLISNASKYSPAGSTIDIIVQWHNDSLRFCFADRGRGIAPEKQNSIFMPFVRLEPESQTDHGSGLGLSVVKAIAEAHRGQVGVDPRPGGGSIFWFTLPLPLTVTEAQS